MSKITQELLEELVIQVSVTVEPSDYRKKVSATLNKYSKTAHVNGFRQGHVPIGLLKKKYGAGIVAEEVYQMSYEMLNAYLKEQNIQYIGTPYIDENQEKMDFQMDVDKDYTFNYQIGLAPQFEVRGLDKNTTIPCKNVVVSDEQVDEEVKSFLAQRTPLVNGTTITSLDDMVVAGLTELDADGNIKEGGIERSGATIMPRYADADVQERLMGLNVGDTLDVEVSKLDSDANLRKYILEVGQHDEYNPIFRMSIAEVRTKKAVELTDEFIASLNFSDVQTIDEMRNVLRKELEGSFQHNANSFVHYELRQVLRAQNTHIPLPAAILKRNISEDVEKQNKSIDEAYQELIPEAQWMFLIDKLALEYGVSVSQEEIRADIVNDIAREAGHLIQQYPDIVRNYVENVLKNKERVQTIEREILEYKTLEAAKQFVNLDVENLTTEAFKEFAKQRNKEIQEAQPKQQPAEEVVNN